jgi:hypothetical protein
MKLTNEIRRRWVGDIMSTIPDTGFKAAAADLIREWAINRLPDEQLANIARDPRQQKWLAHGSFSTPLWDFGDIDAVSDTWFVDTRKENPRLWKRLTALAEKEMAVSVKRKNVRMKLEALAAAHNTIKQLADAAPAFAQFLPSKPQPMVSTPPMNMGEIVKELRKLGWQKG